MDILVSLMFAPLMDKVFSFSGFEITLFICIGVNVVMVVEGKRRSPSQNRRWPSASFISKTLMDSEDFLSKPPMYRWKLRSRSLIIQCPYCLHRWVMYFLQNFSEPSWQLIIFKRKLFFIFAKSLFPWIGPVAEMDMKFNDTSKVAANNKENDLFCFKFHLSFSLLTLLARTNTWCIWPIPFSLKMHY
jgi:hypothetical protein